MNENAKVMDLERRTFLFAQRVRTFVKLVPRTVGNYEDGKQVIRSSGSVAANYVEANEALSRRDFLVRIKVCRKEAKESRLWLGLLDCEGHDQERNELLQEARELTLIFSAIVNKGE